MFAEAWADGRAGSRRRTRLRPGPPRHGQHDHVRCLPPDNWTTDFCRDRTFATGYGNRQAAGTVRATA